MKKSYSEQNYKSLQSMKHSKFVLVEAEVCKWTSKHDKGFKNRNQTEPNRAACDKTKQQETVEKNDRRNGV